MLAAILGVLAALVVGLLVLMPLVYSRGIQAGERRAEIQSRRDMLLDLKSQAILDPTLSDRYVKMLEELIRHQ